MRFSRTLSIFLLAALCLKLCACSPKIPVAISSSTMFAESLHCPGPDGQWLIRQKLILRVPEISLCQSFDGIILVNFQKKTAKIAAMGGMGISLFTATITPDGIAVHSIHPTFAKLPNVQEQIRKSSTALLFYALGPTLVEQEKTQNSIPCTVNTQATMWKWLHNKLYSVAHFSHANSNDIKDNTTTPSWIILETPHIQDTKLTAFILNNKQPAYSLEMHILHIQHKTCP